MILKTTLLLSMLAVPATPPSASESAVASTTGLVVSVSDLASDVGAAVLRRGGNAVDAAVATAFALAVTHPSAGNIGGGGFMVVRPANGDATAIDYRERAPLGATPTMYLGADGRIDRSLTAAGYLAAGVPGTVRGLEMAHKKWGRLPWKELVLPAALLDREGFLLSESLARSLNGQLDGRMAQFPVSVEAYGKPGGGKWAAGDRLVLYDLGRSLQAIAEEGPDVFYRGWIADRIADDMKANGGLITRQDLAAYQAKEREPIRGRYLDYEIWTMPPPSSGGVALVQMLNMLETFDLKGQDRFAPRTLHLMIEAMRRAYLDRARHLGDPDLFPVPVERLTSKEYARRLAGTIDPAKASSSAALGADIVTPPTDSEDSETTHFSVIDGEGMAVSNTYTLEAGYGSRVVVRGAGFLLNNEMGDFNKKPGETNLTGDIGTAANLIAPGKRMLSSMTPTIVTRNGQTVLVTGSPGGRTIINTVLQVVLNLTTFGMDVRAAVDAPRMHHQWLPDSTTLEQDAVPAPTVTELQRLGHAIRVQGRQGDAHTIYVDLKSGAAFGANDRRSPDSKAAR